MGGILNPPHRPKVAMEAGAGKQNVAPKRRRHSAGSIQQETQAGIVFVTGLTPDDNRYLPGYIRVAHPLGKGPDEKAVEAVQQPRFQPAMKDGKLPVAVLINMEVQFRL